MGFFFRKTKSAGPFNFNFSSSGVGVSTGITGARIGAGPQGTTLSLGRGGFYYRKRIKTFSGLRAKDYPTTATPSVTPVALPASLQNTDPDFDDLNAALGSDALLTLRFLLPLPLFLLASPYWALLLFAIVLVGGPRYFTGARWEDKPGQWKFFGILGLVLGGIACYHLSADILTKVGGFKGKADDLAAIGVMAAFLGGATVAAANWKFTEVASALALGFLGLAFATPDGLIAALSAGSIGVLGLIEKNSRWMFLGYSQDGKVTEDSDWTKLLLEGFSRTSALWITTNGQMFQAAAGELTPPHISTPCQMTGIHSQPLDLYFGPNGLLIYDHQRTRFLGFDYAKLKLEHKVRYSSTRGNPPPDSPVVSRRWQHERVSGGPDHRFKFNPSMVVFRLGSVAFTVEDSTFEIVFSHPYVAEVLYRVLVMALEGLRTGVTPAYEPPRQEAAPKPPDPRPDPPPAPQASSEKTRKPRPKPAPAPQPPPSTVRDSPVQRKERAIALFGLVGDWTEKDLASAYRRLAKDYHPDIHANLPPEFRELAHKKMSEITEAYNFLSSQGLEKGKTT